jgi:ABC-type antimicrobial peptide transport system permease subunit
MSVYALGHAPADEVVEHARAMVTTLDSDVPILRANTLADGLVGALTLFNLSAAMLFVFGTTGIVLVALGTYGLMAFAVRQTTREIGIRMALGAAPRRVLRECLERGVRLGVTGAALGVGATLGVTQLLGNVLFGVSATDPASYARAMAIVLGVVMLATLVPAWRASRTSPLQALRHQ